jgi:hypothetical protein
VKLTAKVDVQPQRATTAATRQYRKDLRVAAVIATDRASREAQQAVQAKIRGVGLGNLARAVGHTSTKIQRTPGDPYGVIYAKGGDESRAGGALEAYSQGATIRPGPGHQWLAIPTNAVPKFISIGGQRRRLTPDLYLRSGLMTSIGRLEFRPLGNNEAIWVIKRVSLSPKTGRAKALGPRPNRTRVVQKEVVAFVGRRVTRRARRYDKDGTVGFFARRVPAYMIEALAEIRRGRV